MFLFIFTLTGMLYQTIWFLSRTVDGKVIEFDKGPGKRFKQIESVTIMYSVSHRSYTRTFLRSGVPFDSERVCIRYLSFAPSVSRLNTPAGNWGLVSGIFLTLFLILSIIFLKKDMIPSGCHFIFSFRHPFVKLQTE
jgi:hypothetical protein